ncbi:MAG TPA: hypothetical protein VJS43_09300 [Candidatus Acidoferrales bacterium]|nr:hypothetical protein [Candidatus Acidoferrales bacterium]
MKKTPKTARPISRRDFARGGALAAASAALSASFSQNTSAQTPATEPALSTASEAEVDAKVAAVLRQYGNLLSNQEKLEVRRLLTEGQKPLDTMRLIATNNADQPGDVLKLYPDASHPSNRAAAPGGKG